MRVRRAGTKHFVDVHVEVDGHIPLSRAHGISDAIESQINELLPRADVTIHAEPGGKQRPNLGDKESSLGDSRDKGDPRGWGKRGRRKPHDIIPPGDGSWNKPREGP